MSSGSQAPARTRLPAPRQPIADRGHTRGGFVRAPLRAPLWALLCVVVVAFGSAAAHAYTVGPGEILVRPVAGASVNVLRYAAATRATPQGGMILGVDADVVVDGPLAMTVAFRPVLSSDYVDLNLGVGAKYRLVQLGAPFIPYGAVMATAAVGGPLGAGALHINAGARVGGGMDYFVTRNLAVGLELGLEISALLLPTLRPEATADVLAGVSWRF